MAASTLNLNGLSADKLPDELKGDEPTYISRYLITSEILRQLAGKDINKVKILDVGGYGSLLPRLLNRAIDILDVVDSDEANYTKGDALDMPYKDHSYDYLVTCDVIEHIENKDREVFINELLRVAKKGVILAAPFKKEGIEAAEDRVNGFFKEIFNEEHPWLDEHIRYELPSPNTLEKVLNKKNLSYAKFEHTSMDTWESLTKANFLEVEKEISKDEELSNLIKSLNTTYLNELMESDFSKDGYRSFYVISKNNQEIEVKLPENQEENTDEKVATLADSIIAQMVKKIRTQSQDNKQLNESKRDLEKRLVKSKSKKESLEQELVIVHSSRGWRAIMLTRQMAEILKRKLPKQFKKIIQKTFQYIRRLWGAIPFIKKLKKIIQVDLRRRSIRVDREKEYQTWYKENLLTQSDLDVQRHLAQEFKHKPLISIVMPVYNTDIQHLQECIESVMEQTYEHWELCIADDASSKHEVKETIKRYARQDERIKYVLRKENGHICHASNSALELATGEYVSLLDHDDFLWPNALYEIAKLINDQPAAGLIYTDEDKIEEDGATHSEPFFKPDWSPDYLRTINYITHFTTIRKSLVDEIGGFRPGCEGAQDWDLILRASNSTDEIHHIPKIVYSWRKSINSTAQAASSKDYAYTNQKGVLEEDLEARGYNGKAIKGKYPGYWRIKYRIEGKPLVSIVIPTKDRYEYIKTCLKSLKKTTYKNLEVVIIDTGSEDPKVWKLYNRFKRSHKQTKVAKWTEPFNFASVCNYGAQEASGDYLLFLNNDTEVITRDWVEGLLEHAQREEVGAAGCKLLYPDKRIQHAGVVLGVGGTGITPGIAGHFFQLYNDEPMEDPFQNIYIGGVRDFAAVTAACLLVSRQKFEAVDGFDPDFQIAFNDVDFCLKLHNKGWNNVYTPHVKLYHHESVSVGQPGSKDRDAKVFDKEIALMGERWGWELINNDPYYHPEFSRDAANARIDIH